MNKVVYVDGIIKAECIKKPTKTFCRNVKCRGVDFYIPTGNQEKFLYKC